MLRNFRLAHLKEPRVAVRAVLGVLLAANLVAAVLAFKPWGGSAEDLAREEIALRQQLGRAQAALAKSKTLAAKVDRARDQGGAFLERYTTDRRTTFSTIVAELDQAAKQAGIKPRPLSIELDQVEGSDTLMQMTISAAYEGNYQNLTRFVNLLDKSPRFLIIESLAATPVQGGATLNVTFKLDTFVRELPGSAS